MRLPSVSAIVRRKMVSDQLSRLKSTLGKLTSPRILDVGSGRLPWKHCFSDLFGLQYETVDLRAEFKPTYQESFFNISPKFKFDLIIATEFLEHISDPKLFFLKSSDLLAENGQLLISVPFLFRVHGDPNDYYRFTRDGLIALSKKCFLLEGMASHGNRFLVAWEVLIDGKWLLPFRLFNPLLSKIFSYQEYQFPLGYVALFRKK